MSCWCTEGYSSLTKFKPAFQSLKAEQTDYPPCGGMRFKDRPLVKETDVEELLLADLEQGLK